MWRAAIILLLLVACSRKKDPVPAISTGGFVGNSGVTRWNITDFVISNEVIIPAATPMNSIYFEMSAGGLYIMDNGVNECNGRYTTDNISKINFDDKIICTNINGDPDSYGKLKTILTQQVEQFAINSDTTVLTLSRDNQTYIRLKRLK